MHMSMLSLSVYNDLYVVVRSKYMAYKEIELTTVVRSIHESLKLTSSTHCCFLIKNVVFIENTK